MCSGTLVPDVDGRATVQSFMRPQVVNLCDPDMDHLIELLERKACVVFRLESDALMYFREGGAGKFVYERVVERFEKTFDKWFVVWGT
ncbi:hypothetical protein WS76_00055 [Burkholderia humptydooensis]|nr:hypothetical protein WS76_00055 [Burkholderia humptydooensis]